MTALRILVAHNAYRQRGGEDTVVESEAALLGRYGAEVVLYTRHNDEIVGMPRGALARQTLWSRRTEADIARCVQDFRPDVIHAHNTFPLISPSLYVAAGRAGVPVVQTLHNFRLMCLNAMFLRDGRACEDCSGRLPWRGVARSCYRGSAAQSAVLASALALHRMLGTYRNKVTRYIALNEFCRSKFIDGGLPPERLVVKPNFVDIPISASEPRHGGLFVGRLSAEKGIAVLTSAMEQLPACQLKVIGSASAGSPLLTRSNVRALGFQPREVIFQHMHRASYLLMPSIWYETFGLVAIEAFACSLPVIASRIGAMAEMIDDGRTGLLFEPGSARELAAKIAWAEAHPGAMLEMGRNARREYEAKYTPERNYRELLAVYMDAIAACRGDALR